MMDDCLFCKIVRGELHAEVVYEDERALAFKDINPQAPVHVLIIPKKHIVGLAEPLDEKEEGLLGHLLRVGSRVARDFEITERGFRTVINANAEAGQSVYHLHLHILGGRPMKWPPG